jgi:hypothetical protein
LAGPIRQRRVSQGALGAGFAARHRRYDADADTKLGYTDSDEDRNLGVHEAFKSNTIASSSQVVGVAAARARPPAPPSGPRLRPLARPYAGRDLSRDETASRRDADRDVPRSRSALRGSGVRIAWWWYSLCAVCELRFTSLSPSCPTSHCNICGPEDAASRYSAVPLLDYAVDRTGRLGQRRRLDSLSRANSANAWQRHHRD